jgi:hypothetical protein
MPADFPDNPVIGESFSIGGRAWTWNGSTWDAVIVPPAVTFAASATAPVAPADGSGWFDTNTGQFFIYYDEHWVEFGTSFAGPEGQQGATGATGAQGIQGEPGKFIVSDTEPTNPTEGVGWFDSTSSRTYIYFDDLWIEIIGAPGPAGTDGVDGVDGASADSDQVILAAQIFG